MKTVVLIPHFNNPSGLAKSIASIHHHPGIDVLVVDDGSLPQFKPELEKLQAYVNNNVRLKIHYLEKNVGIQKALNIGLQLILDGNRNVQYIARIDCGDIAVRNRFLLQETFLSSHPEIDLVGSWVKFTNEQDEYLFSVNPPVNHKSIRRKMSIRCSFIHPSVMYRRAMVEKLGLYPEYEAAEDYAYFFDAVQKTRTANIPGYLTFVEMNERGISSEKRRIQSINKLRIINRFSRKDMYYFFGMAYNVGLICTPKSVVYKTKRLLFR